jgi:hypothetical protein
MIKGVVSMQEDRLGFLAKAKTAFKFLESYGFKIVKEDLGFIRYENTSYFINICHGRISYELHIELGHRGSEDRYDLEDIIGMTDPIEEGKYFRPMPYTPESLDKFIEMHVQLLKKYGESLLNGDANTWDELHKYHERSVIKYWNNMQRESIQEKAAIAFRERRYSDFIKLYAGLEADLTQLERKKIEYAKRKIIR